MLYPLSYGGLTHRERYHSGGSFSKRHCLSGA